jgi:hypothetical protein
VIDLKKKQRLLVMDYGSLLKIKLNIDKMNIEVDIYLSNFIKFFKSNPEDLLSLVPKEMEEEFYQKVREVSTENVNKGSDAQLTQRQIIDICVGINRKLSNPMQMVDKEPESYIIGTKFGSIFK